MLVVILVIGFAEERKAFQYRMLGSETYGVGASMMVAP